MILNNLTLDHHTEEPNKPTIIQLVFNTLNRRNPPVNLWEIVFPFFDIEINIRRKTGQSNYPGHLEALAESATVGVAGSHGHDHLQALEVFFGRGLVGFHLAGNN